MAVCAVNYGVGNYRQMQTARGGPVQQNAAAASGVEEQAKPAAVYSHGKNGTVADEVHRERCRADLSGCAARLFRFSAACRRVVIRGRLLQDLDFAVVRVPLGMQGQILRGDCTGFGSILTPIQIPQQAQQGLRQIGPCCRCLPELLPGIFKAIVPFRSAARGDQALVVIGIKR